MQIIIHSVIHKRRQTFNTKRNSGSRRVGEIMAAAVPEDLETGVVQGVAVAEVPARARSEEAEVLETGVVRIKFRRHFMSCCGRALAGSSSGLMEFNSTGIVQGRVVDEGPAPTNVAAIDAIQSTPECSPYVTQVKEPELNLCDFLFDSPSPEFPESDLKFCALILPRVVLFLLFLVLFGAFIPLIILNVITIPLVQGLYWLLPNETEGGERKRPCSF